MKSFLATALAIVVLLLLSGPGRAIAADAGDAGADADWEQVPNPDDPKPDQVLEIPQACTRDGVTVPCDDDSNLASAPRDSSGDDDDEDDTDIARRGSPGSAGSPAANDGSGSADAQPDWGSVDEYQNEEAYVPAQVPYGQVPYGASYAVVRPSGTGRPMTPVPASAYPVPMVAMSSPLTAAATPPLNPTGGPWMTPPSMSPFARPAGSAMMPASSLRLH
ncbi:MAG TPA: hypothetical protein VFI80_02970 [Burkholderiales bacterium]|nr:hypothetical protein [Burkholderiales bacterium]